MRQAILYGINYNGIVAALKGAAIPSSGLVPDGLFGHFQQQPPELPLRPGEGRQLLNRPGTARARSR